MSIRLLAPPVLAVLTVVAAALAACDGGAPPTAPDAGPRSVPTLAFGALPATAHCNADADAVADDVQLALKVLLVNGADCATTTVTNTRPTPPTTATGAFDARGEASATLTLVGGDAPGAQNTLNATCTTPAGAVLTTTAAVRDDCVIVPATAQCAIVEPAPGAHIAAASTTVQVTTTSAGSLSADQVALVAAGQVACTADNGTSVQTREMQLTHGAGAADLTLPGNGDTAIDCTLVDARGLLAPVSCSVEVIVTLP